MSIPETLASMDTVLSFAVIVAIKATILLALAFVATFALRRASAAVRHLVWALAIGGVVALPFVVAISPALPLLPAPPAPAPAVADAEHEVGSDTRVIERYSRVEEPFPS